MMIFDLLAGASTLLAAATCAIAARLLRRRRWEEHVDQAIDLARHVPCADRELVMLLMGALPTCPDQPERERIES